MWGLESQGWPRPEVRILDHKTARIQPCLTWVLSQADLRDTLSLTWDRLTWPQRVTTLFSHPWCIENTTEQNKTQKTLALSNRSAVNGFGVAQERQGDQWKGVDRASVWSKLRVPRTEGWALHVSCWGTRWLIIYVDYVAVFFIHQDLKVCLLESGGKKE